MKKAFTFLLGLSIIIAGYSADPTFLRPDGAYASSMYINPDEIGHLYPEFLITPADQGDVIHPYYTDDSVVIGRLTEESRSATHPTSNGGDRAFGAWHSAPNGLINPMTDETFNTPIDEQWVVLSFNAPPQTLDSILIWNIHQVNGGSVSNNEVKTFTVEATNDSTGTWTEVLGSSTLDDNTDAGVPVSAKGFKLTGAAGKRFIRINIEDNYGHEKNAGLAEVRFIGTPGTTSISEPLEHQIDVISFNKAIEIKNAPKGSQYAIYNLAGVLVKSGVVDNSNYSVKPGRAGMYILKIENGQKPFVKKVVLY